MSTGCSVRDPWRAPLAPGFGHRRRRAQPPYPRIEAAGVAAGRFLCGDKGAMAAPGGQATGAGAPAAIPSLSRLVSTGIDRIRTPVAW